jgi:hypothetical protein
MSFFFQTIAIPFWFIVFILASATPLWIEWYKKFHKKFITTGVLQKKFKRAQTVAEMKVDVLKKATDHWNENTELPSFSKSKKKQAPKKSIDQIKKKNIQTVLIVLAEGGEVGVLPQSISDKANITINDVKNALVYLIEKKYAEEVNSTNGIKFYLTGLGKKYCINKKYIQS